MCQFHTNQNEPIVFLRGLQARCRWAAAHDSTEPESGDGYDDAYSQGMQDFEHGRAFKDVPPLLADIADLAAAWREGWKWADELNGMGSCSCCQDSNIDVCHVHG